MQTGAAAAANLAEAKQAKSNMENKHRAEPKTTYHKIPAAAGAGAGMHPPFPPAQAPSAAPLTDAAISAFNTGLEKYKKYKEEREHNEPLLKEAIQALAKASQLKHPDAQYQLGIVYKNSFINNQKTKELAFKMFERAANAGHIKAKIEYAICYLEETGVPKNLKQALRILESMTINDPDEEDTIEFQKLRCRIELVLIEKNSNDFGFYTQKLFRYYSGFPEAVVLLYRIFYDTQEGNKNLFSVNAPLDEAISLDSAYAPAHLEKAKIFEADADWKNAFITYQKARVYGSMLAAVRLGLCYLFGRGTKQNPAEALKLFKTAELNGCVYAQLGLAIYQLETSPITPTKTSQKEGEETGNILQQALNKLDPFLEQSNVEANLALMRYYTKRGLTNKALEHFNKWSDVLKDKESLELLKEILNQQHEQQLQKTQKTLADKESKLTADAKKNAENLLAAQEKLAEQEKNNDLLRTENRNKTTELQREVSERQSVAARLQSLKEEMEAHSLRTAATIETMTKTIQQLTRDKSELQDSHQKTSTEKRETDNEMLRLKQELHHLRRQQIVHENQSIKDKTDLRILRGKLASATKDAENFSQNITSLKTELTALKNQKTLQFTHLAAQLAETQQSVRSLQEQYNASQNKVSDLLAEIQQLKIKSETNQKALRKELEQKLEQELLEQNKEWNDHVRKLMIKNQNKEIADLEERLKELRSRPTANTGDHRVTAPLLSAQSQVSLAAPVMQPPLVTQPPQPVFRTAAPAAQPLLLYPTQPPQPTVVAGPAVQPLYYLPPQPQILTQVSVPILHSHTVQRDQVSQIGIHAQHYLPLTVTHLPNQPNKP